MGLLAWAGQTLSRLSRLNLPRFGGILGTMEIQSAVLSEVVLYKGLCFQWLILFNADGDAEYKYRVGVGEVAGDWVGDEKNSVAAEDLNTYMTILPDLPLGDGQNAVDALLEHFSPQELARNPLPEWKPVEWFEAGLPDHIRVHVTRKFTEM